MTDVLWSPTPDNAPDEALIARRFGAGLADLSVSFASPLDDTLTALLSACLRSSAGAAFSPEEIDTWTIQKRRQGLLAIAVATFGTRRDIVATCPEQDCGTRLDLEVDLTAFRQDWRIQTIDLLLADGTELVLRHPTPQDLRAYGLHTDDTNLALRLIDGAPPDCEWLSAVEAALSEADPLTDLELQGECPDCGGAIQCPLLLEPFLTRELAGSASVLMDEIHVLALGYHWTEQEIMALPDDRRRHYLARIQEAWAA